MIKILFFIPSLSDGGAEKVLRNLVNNMEQSKFDITVQTIDDDKNAKYLTSGIRYKCICGYKSKFGKKIFQYWFRLCAELKILYPLYVKDDYDIEVAYLECGATKIISSSTNKRAKKIAWVHCDLTKKEGFANSIKKTKKYYEKFDKVVCVSETVEEGFKKAIGNVPETLVLHNVNDEKEILEKSVAYKVAKDENKKMIVAVGRLAKEKSFDRLLEVCKLLKEDGCDFQLHIIGEGAERMKLESMIKEYALAESVFLEGFIDNPYPYIKAADVIACSSLYEGLSTVVIESLILGKPIATTPCGGMKELLGNSEYGIIAEDSVQGLYKEIKKLLLSEEERVCYAQAAGERGKEFSKGTIIRRTEEFFENIC